MVLEPNICYRAVISRDPRFDGKFFIGVKSTGIYCRSICPAPRAQKKARQARSGKNCDDRPPRRSSEHDSRVISKGQLTFDSCVSLEATRAELGRIPGIGSWTASYIAMRALREPDAFPADDLGIRRALSENRNRPVTEKSAWQRSQSWRPWRAYAAMVLWRSLG